MWMDIVVLQHSVLDSTASLAFRVNTDHHHLVLWQILYQEVLHPVLLLGRGLYYHPPLLEALAIYTKTIKPPSLFVENMVAQICLSRSHQMLLGLKLQRLYHPFLVKNHLTVQILSTGYSK